jgi:hypothetical protein
MTLVRGIIKDILGNEVPGQLVIESDLPIRVEPIRDPDGLIATPPVQLRPFPVTVDCPNGIFEIDLHPDATTTYSFEYLRVNTDKTYWSNNGRDIYTGLVHNYEGSWYSGATHDSESELLYVTEEEQTEVVMPRFRAIIPDRNQIDFADLAPTGISASNQDTSLLALALLITTRNEYLDPIANRVAELMNEN